MKAKIEPKRWGNIINSAMVDGEITPIRLRAGDKGIMAVNLSDSGHLLSVLLAKTNPEKAKGGYFLEYEGNTEPEEITFGKEVKDRLSWGFKKEDLTITADEDNMTIDDGTDKLPVELDEKINKKVPIPITGTEYGLVPDFNLYKLIKEGKEKPEDWNDKNVFEGFNVYKTSVSNLGFPGSVTNYRIELKEGEMSVSIGGTSTSFIHKIEGELISGGNRTILVDANNFKSVINNLEGEVYLIFNDLVVIFVETVHEFLKKSFSLATKEE